MTSSLPRSSSQFRYILYAGLFLLPIIGYWTTVWIVSYNLPIFDDYIIQLETANLRHASNWWDKLTILFGQLNEHRLAYTRFWFWITSALTGSVAYKFLIFIGNASLIGIVLLGYGQVRRLAVPVSTWLPVSWLLFQFQFYPNSIWAMASLQNLTIHFLYLLLFVLIIRPGRNWFIGACVAAAVLVYTSGNGFFGPVLSISVLVYQRRYRELVIWILLILGLLVTYFLSYQPVEQLTTGPSISLSNWILGVILFLGLAVNFPFVGTTLLALAGAVFLLLAVSLSLASLWQLIRHNPGRQFTKPAYAVMAVCILVYGFIIASTIVVVRGRWVLGGWEGILQPRYFFYSSMLIVTIYAHLVAFFADYVRRWQPAVWGLVIASAIYWALTFQYNLARMFEFSSRALSDYFNWTQVQPASQQQFIGTVFHPNDSDQTTLQQIKKALNQTETLPADSTRRIEPISQSANSRLYVISGVAPSRTFHDWRYLVMQSPNQVLLMPVVNTTNTKMVDFWLNRNLFTNTFSSDASTFVASAPTYRIGLLRRDGEQMSVFFSDNYLDPKELKAGNSHK